MTFVDTHSVYPKMRIKNLLYLSTWRKLNPQQTESLRARYETKLAPPRVNSLAFFFRKNQKQCHGIVAFFYSVLHIRVLSLVTKHAIVVH